MPPLCIIMEIIHLQSRSLIPDDARCRGGSATFVNIDNDGFLDMGIFGYRDGGGANGDGLGSWLELYLI